MYVRWALTMFGVAFLVMLLWGLLNLLGYFLAWWWWADLIGGIVRLVFAVMAVASYGYVRARAYAPLVAGQLHMAYQAHMPCIILGFIFGLGIAGVLLVLAYMKISELVTAPPAPPPPPPPGAAPPPPPPTE